MRAETILLVLYLGASLTIYLLTSFVDVSNYHSLSPTLLDSLPKSNIFPSQFKET